jgi:hypothetical protein
MEPSALKSGDNGSKPKMNCKARRWDQIENFYFKQLNSNEKVFSKTL